MGAGQAGGSWLWDSDEDKIDAEDIHDRRCIRRLQWPENLSEFYGLRRGIGMNGGDDEPCSPRERVFLASCLRTGAEVVVKKRSKRTLALNGGSAQWRTKLGRLLNLEDHSNVLGIREAVEDDTHFYVVMEHCGGGELFDFLYDERDVPQAECRRIIQELLEAVAHMHEQGLVHRDIKPENVMFNDDSPRKTIKLIDFDSVVEYEPTSPTSREIVGTFGYISPEALRGEYVPASDLWSVGVIFYVLMTGDMPFKNALSKFDLPDNRVGSPAAKELYDRLKHDRIEFEGEPWISCPLAQQLCECLLAFEFGDRPLSAVDVLKHPFFDEKAESMATTVSRRPRGRNS